MKAAILKAYGYPPIFGDYDQLEPGPDQLLVRLTAASITPLDLLCASGTSYFGAPALPYIPGVQGVGVVESGISSLVGRQVWFQTTSGMKPGNGSMSEYVTVFEKDIFEVPEGLSAVDAAALGLSAVAGWNAVTTAKVTSEDAVIVLGASGIVGQVALQVARHLGAKKVVGSVRSPEAQEIALSLGADEVVDLSKYSEPALLTRRFEEATEGGADVVIDPIFGEPASCALRALKSLGRLVNLGSAASEVAVFDSATIRSRRLSILGYTNVGLNKEEIDASLSEIFNLAKLGKLKVFREVVPLAEVTSAWQRQMEGKAKKRLVLVP